MLTEEQRAERVSYIGADFQHEGKESDRGFAERKATGGVESRSESRRRC